MVLPLFDTATQLGPLREEIRTRVGAVIDGGAYVLGPELAAFEREFAAYLGARHVIGVANGTDAITIALRALGVAAGDEVVVPSFTFYASAEAVVNAGAVPVFCDVDPATRNVSRETVAAVLSPNTRAILAVDLFGCPAPVGELAELGVAVLEDAAQAAGAALDGRRAGTLGDIGTFSFYPSKNLGAMGDGGAIVTDRDDLAELVRALRFHGSRDKKQFEYVGFNSRLDEVQAAILRVLLPHLDAWSAKRRDVAAAYERSGLADCLTLPRPPAGASPAWHLYVAQHEDPDRLIAQLAEDGIQARGYYRTPVHRQPAMARWGSDARLPVTEELAATNLALPMSPSMSESQIEQVAGAVRRRSLAT